MKRALVLAVMLFSGCKTDPYETVFPHSEDGRNAPTYLAELARLHPEDRQLVAQFTYRVSDLLPVFQPVVQPGATLRHVVDYQREWIRTEPERKAALLQK